MGQLVFVIVTYFVFFERHHVMGVDNEKLLKYNLKLLANNATNNLGI